MGVGGWGRREKEMIRGVKGNEFVVEVVIVIVFVEGIWGVLVERVGGWSRDGRMLGIGCVGGFDYIFC